MNISLKIILIPVLVAVLVVALIKRGTFSSINFKTRNSVKWVAGVYVAGLLLSVAVLYMLPQAGFAASQNNESPVVDIYFAAKSGMLDQTEGVLAKSERSFDYKGTELELTAEPTMMVWVQRKETDDAKLDVIYYVSKSTIDGVDYSDRIKPPTLELVGNRLVVTNPEGYEVKLTKFKQDVTVSQFSDHLIIQPGFSGQKDILFLRIPKSLIVDDPPKRLQFVGE